MQPMTRRVDTHARCVTDWFVVNVGDAEWFARDEFGAGCPFESSERPFPELGINIRVLEPGEANARYHRESAQEDFLVLAGECLLLIEEEERLLRAWDFVHCPAGTAHVFVGAGTGPCVVLMAGARRDDLAYHYPVSELARRHGTGVATATDSPAEAYAGAAPWEPRRPRSWDGLPWARAARSSDGTAPSSRLTTRVKCD
jgi:uncharacterized cupin superfamily protein